jgi:hypothetical protein
MKLPLHKNAPPRYVMGSQLADFVEESALFSTKQEIQYYTTIKLQMRNLTCMNQAQAWYSNGTR